MMQEIVEATLGWSDLQKLAVTVVTSLSDSDLREIGINKRCKDQVIRLARLAETSGCHGIVSSPKQIKSLRTTLLAKMAIVTPRVRPEQEHYLGNSGLWC
ncbi:MAG: hypothetical protein NTV34_16715, partial [Proteobacteria bacterium]|nr:hypothetical protein [Pseudomonadota bacterium]